MGAAVATGLGTVKVVSPENNNANDLKTNKLMEVDLKLTKCANDSASVGQNGEKHTSQRGGNDDSDEESESLDKVLSVSYACADSARRNSAVSVLVNKASTALGDIGRRCSKDPSHITTVSHDEVELLKDAMTQLKNRADKSQEYEFALNEAIRAAPELFDQNFKRYISEQFGSKMPGLTPSNTEMMSNLMMRRAGSMFLRRNKSVKDSSRDPRLAVESEDSTALEKLMHTSGEWGFDIFELDRLAKIGAMPILGEAIFSELALLEALSCNKSKFRNFLVSISEMYCDVPYHNSLHGADVCQTVFYFMRKGGLMQDLEVDKTFAILLSALVHDVGHPGLNNKFLVQTQHSFAVTYNDRSPLENMHAATAFRVLARPDCNFLEEIPVPQQRAIRSDMIEIILATDNDRHTSLMSEIEACKEAGYNLGVPEAAASTALLKLQMVLHAADLSNTLKPWDIYTKWTSRVMEEFYAQGDRERRLGLPVSYAFDRTNPVPMTKFQLSFMNIIVKPLYIAFHAWPGIDITECLLALEANLNTWKIKAEEKRFEEEKKIEAITLTDVCNVSELNAECI